MHSHYEKVFSLTSLKVCQSLLCVQFAIHIDEATFSLCDDKLLLPQSTCSHERSTEEARILTKLMGFHGYVNCVFLLWHNLHVILIHGFLQVLGWRREADHKTRLLCLVISVVNARSGGCFIIRRGFLKYRQSLIKKDYPQINQVNAIR